MDLEMSLVSSESATQNKAPLPFPAPLPSPLEETAHTAFREQFGYDFNEIERLLDVWYPRV